ncbi:hypothetical protein N8Z15_02040 [Pelagibacteraceae bacterium]|nr:hypothetical protein [Pelagibacteraceae bacterium]
MLFTTRIIGKNILNQYFKTQDRSCIWTITANEEPAGDPVDGDTPYIKFRVELSTPFTLKPGKMPNVQVALNLTNTVQFDNATVYLFKPNAPVVSITFVE